LALLSGGSSGVLAGLFATLERTQPRLRPDGKGLGYLAPANSGELNLAVAPVDSPLSRHLVTRYKQHVRGWEFLPDNQRALCLHDDDGNERFVLDVVDLESREVVTLAEDVESWWVEPDDREAVLVAYPAGSADVWRIDLATKERRKVISSPSAGSTYLVSRGRVLAAITSDRKLLRNLNGSWDPLLEAKEDEELTPIGANGTQLFVRTNAGADLVGVEQIDFDTGLRTVLFRDEADVQDVDFWDGEVVSILAGRLIPDVHVLDKRREAAFSFIRSVDPGVPWVLSRAGSQWVVRFTDPGRPPRYMLVDVHHQTSEPLFDEIPWHPRSMGGGPHGYLTSAFEVSSEGEDLPSYLTFPVPANESKSTTWPQGQWPLVLLVHGGPWARDDYAFEPTVHWLASQGYMVLRVNFRGSRGFGKEFLERGDGAWGDGMLTDLMAGVQQVRDAGKVRDPDVAVMGESFGGYATLALLTLPNSPGGGLRCGVDEFGPSDLTKLGAELPAKYASAKQWLAERLGDTKALADASPVQFAASLRAPLLIAQGADDPRVKEDQSKAFVSAAPAQLVEYLRFDHEGHGFTRVDDRLAFYRKAEAFLQKCFAPAADDADDA
jgi:dipeptidyl aminopeptidase/acylaminoacyl peptidase